MIDRYAALVAHADTGLGLDEYSPARSPGPQTEIGTASAPTKEPAEATNPTPTRGQDQW